jgi:hypothetical protein
MVFPGIGTLVNVITVLVGTVIGVLVGHRLTQRTRDVVTDGLGLVATVRRATVSALRAKLPVEPPAAARVGSSSRSHRSVGQVLAQRRSLRRAQEKMLG